MLLPVVLLASFSTSVFGNDFFKNVVGRFNSAVRENGARLNASFSAPAFGEYNKRQQEYDKRKQELYRQYRVLARRNPRYSFLQFRGLAKKELCGLDSKQRQLVKERRRFVLDTKIERMNSFAYMILR